MKFDMALICYMRKAKIILLIMISEIFLVRVNHMSPFACLSEVLKAPCIQLLSDYTNFL